VILHDTVVQGTSCKMENSLFNIISHSQVHCLVNLLEILLCDPVDKLHVGKVEVVKRPQHYF
jgi:hypothetical protein